MPISAWKPYQRGAIRSKLSIIFGAVGKLSPRSRRLVLNRPDELKKSIAPAGSRSMPFMMFR